MMKLRKLNNKGFTLIELLAVVVILAVVMGIAMTSVLSSMNKSRGGSLSDSASVIANAFNQKRTEAMVDGVPSDVYGDVLKSTDAEKKGYDFQSDLTAEIPSGLATTFNISEDSYALGNAANSIADNATAVSNSFVSYNNETGKFVVCMVAKTTGNYYVKSFAKKKEVKDINGKKYTFADGTMYSCSNGEKSW